MIAKYKANIPFQLLPKKLDIEIPYSNAFFVANGT
jgi:hypothetical protein